MHSFTVPIQSTQLARFDDAHRENGHGQKRREKNDEHNDCHVILMLFTAHDECNMCCCRELTAGDSL